MRIGIVTNTKAPYRNIQWETIAQKYSLRVYYTAKNVKGRKWDVPDLKGIPEINLPVIIEFGKYGFLNKGLLSVVKENESLLIGGYEQPTYILLSLLCRLYKKPYYILHDGISPKKIPLRERKIKFLLKKIVIQGAKGFFTNGTVGKKYFMEKFDVKENKIFNQFLSVDNSSIMMLKDNQEVHKQRLRAKYNITEGKKVIIFSGRLVKTKNVDDIIKSIGILKTKNEYLLLVIGDGEEKGYLESLARVHKVEMVITGFIENQLELFRHYYLGKVLILPSSNEVWGLVVNEGMAAGLPVIVSNECGCSEDLVKENINGFIVNTHDVKGLAEKIHLLDVNNNYTEFGENSLKIISKWSVNQSAESFSEMMASF
ncbi:glycosyltransferase family 4 protein [Planococcus sp. CAU13]|uniref:glycosyltransferase family 4 protein n=1 Tax=Planococcus sp. CAU13 TaxID=1541197 RepID=UPI00052FE974|nr:glycosyltransferase family 4 protein [Planococcus sp. CAU13]